MVNPPRSSFLAVGDFLKEKWQLEKASKLLRMEDDFDSADLPHVNLVFIGPCGSGKSTMAGRLIADSGAIDKENLERIADEAAESGQPDRCYAWILDKLKCERERGNTMFVALWRLASRRCRFTVIDAPGHNDFASDIVTAMSQADIAVLVVPAVQEDQVGTESEGQIRQQQQQQRQRHQDQIGTESEGQILGQIREHTLLAYTLGLRQLVVCVNKMDNDAVAYSQECFDSACSGVREALKDAGLKTHDVYFDVHFVPTSGWKDDNVMCRSEYTPWYCGPTLVEALDDAVASHFKPERPLRFPLREVMKVGGKGTVIVGRVETGSLKCGMELVFAPGNTRTKVNSITMHHETVQEAFCGDIVNVMVDADTSELHSGMVGSAADDDPALESSSFLAQVIVLNDPRAGEITAGCVLSVACHTSQVLCVFEELLSRTDRRTGKVLEMRPKALRAGDAAVVRLRPDTPLCVEPFGDYPPLGRFSVHDQKITVAVGVVQQVEQVAHAASFLSEPITATAKPSRSSSKPTSKPDKEKKFRSSPKSEKRPPSVRNADFIKGLPYLDDSGEEGSLASCVPGGSGKAGYVAAAPPPLPSLPSWGSSPFAAFGAVAKKAPRGTPQPVVTSRALGGVPVGGTSDEGSPRTPVRSSPFAAFGAVAKKGNKLPREVPRAPPSPGKVLGGGSGNTSDECSPRTPTPVGNSPFAAFGAVAKKGKSSVEGKGDP
ncbi:unnamed protein product [Polarella glacialis]|uniref:Tr-type G domain-containing protein n=1 Tax=Polarella glacialis TaxID=89957 RepID=A0A813J9L7_POLGL|nr:unnamed protein product [Polarella glacialis]